MSTRTVRGILAGIALVIALTLTLPPATEAAGISSAPRDADVATLVWQWLSALWNGELWRSPLAEKPPEQPPAHGTSRATAPPPGPSSAPTCNGDQGVCIDPNG